VYKCNEFSVQLNVQWLVLIMNVDARWLCFICRPRYANGTGACPPLMEGCVDTTTDLDASENFLPQPVIDPRITGPPAHGLVTVPAILSCGLLHLSLKFNCYLSRMLRLVSNCIFCPMYYKLWFNLLKPSGNFTYHQV
jgi:hypothetical protein